MTIGRQLRSHEIKSSDSSAKVKTLHFIEFQSVIINLFNKVSGQRFSPKAIFQEIIKTNNFFTKIDDDTFEVTVNWLRSEGNRDIRIQLVYIKNEYQLHFIHDEECFLTMNLTNYRELIIEPHCKNQLKWTQYDILDLVSNINEVLQIENIIYKNKKPVILPHLKSEKEKPTLSKIDFDQLINKYTKQNITYRIQHIILDHAQKRKNNFTFFLDWTDKNNNKFPLEVTFKRNNAYHSWFLSEERLFNYFYPTYDMKPGQFFYTLTVEESNKNKVLHDWFTTDGQLAELHDVKKGTVEYEHGVSLSGSEVLEIHKFFIRFIRPNMTFITDDAQLIGDDGVVPLRLIQFLVYYQTLYEKSLGAKIFHCTDLKTAHEGNIGQNERVFRQHGDYLIHLNLRDWQIMLEQERDRLSAKKTRKKFSSDEAELKQLIRDDAKLQKVILDQDIDEEHLLINFELRQTILKRKNGFLCKKYEEYESYRHAFTACDELKSLKSKYLDKSAEKQTLSLLVSTIWNQSKMEKTQGPSADLIHVSQLLCKGLDIDDKEVDPETRDAQVTTKVRTRLRQGGRFWYHTLPDEKSEDRIVSEKKHYKLS